MEDALDAFSADMFGQSSEWSGVQALQRSSDIDGFRPQMHHEDIDGTIALSDFSERPTLALTSTNTTSPQLNEDGGPEKMDVDDIWTVPTSPQDEQAADDTIVDGVISLSKDEIEQRDDPGDPSILKYQLRPQMREVRPGFTSTWIDEDKTGDYDPSEEFRKRRLLRNRMKLRAQWYTRFTTENSDDDGADDDSTPKVIPKLIITLSFQSEAGKSKFERLATFLPAKAEPIPSEPSTGYRLRKNPAVTCLYDSEWNSQKSHFALDLPSDLTGHPIARGCWECLGIGIECPLLKDERSWPCSTCLDDDHDCDLVTPPIRKRACERCKRRRIVCSYNITPNHGEACQQCMDEGYRCVAGPAKDAIRTRIRYDRDWVKDPLPKEKPPKPRKKVARVDHRKAHRPSSFSATGSIKQASAADISGESCSVGAHGQQYQSSILPRETTKKRKSGNNSGLVLPSIFARIVKQSGGTSKMTSTKFCHPISFNYEDKTNGKLPCHFCAEIGYAMFGLGAKEVEVVDWEDGRGMEEVSGGHKGEGIENTRICASCSLSRLRIIMCLTHELQPIPGVQKDALDMNAAFTELMSGTAGMSRRWCVVCPSLALYECCTPSDGSKGCGLMLCEQCKVTLTGLYDGDLQKMLPELEDEATDQRMLGLRADYKLLKQDGLLMRYVLWDSQN